MTLYCRNGHRVGPDPVIEGMDAGAGSRCPHCRVSLDVHTQTHRVPVWPVVLVVLVAAALVGAWWWWLWLAPR